MDLKLYLFQSNLKIKDDKKDRSFKKPSMFLLKLAIVFCFFGTQKGFYKRRENYSAWSLINVIKAFNKLQKAASHCAVLCLLNFFFLIWNHQETLKRNNYISWPPCLTFFIKFLDLRADLGRRFLCIGSAFIMLFQPQRRGGGGEGVLPYKGLMGTCSQPGYVFRQPTRMFYECLKQSIKNRNSALNRIGKSAIFVLNRVRVWRVRVHLPIQGYIEYPPGFQHFLNCMFRTTLPNISTRI